MDRFTERINTIITDREHGSSTLVQWIIDALGDRGDNTPSRAQRRWALKELRNIDCSMVVVHHLLDTLGTEPGDDFQARLDDYVHRWSDIPARVARQLLSLGDWNGARVLLHSHSGMLLSAIEQAHQAAPTICFCQTRSLPGDEGATQHRFLTDRGIACDLVNDESIASLVPSLDAAWLGVDQYDDHCFVNKVGSGRIARTLLAAGKPVYVLGDSRKRVRQVAHSGELFEAVPFTEGLHLVTEDGVQPTVSEADYFS
ncbi:hypothetical protein ACJO2E_08100 [Marinobacter sp. M1N3S26]|uniref:hypothetical protein n=1 Tax=Marinobacter sp. M1N3S26 TaxID=3382299 RepID=UPI00387B8E2D